MMSSRYVENVSSRYYAGAMATKRTPPPSDTADKFMLRMPDGMREQIAERAKRNNRSMNAEIIARLEASFVAPSLDDVDVKMEDFREPIKKILAEILDDRSRNSLYPFEAEENTDLPSDKTKTRKPG